MYKTYFITVPSLVLSHGTFLKGQHVTLEDNIHTRNLVEAGILSTKPNLKPRPKVDLSPKVINTEEVADTPSESVQSAKEPVELVESSDEPNAEELKPKQQVRKKRNVRRKRSTERSS